MKKGWLIVLFFAWSSLMGQDGNCQIYRSLVEDYGRSAGAFQKVEGVILPDCRPVYPTDSLSEATLNLGTPQVQYQRIAKRQFIRQLQVPLAKVYGDSLKTDTLMYIDTLTNANLRAVLAQSPESLQGEDPRAFKKWIQPAIIVTSSVAVLLTLFLVRSPD